MKFNQFLSLSVVSALLLTCLSGCAGSSSTASGSEAASSAAVSSAAASEIAALPDGVYSADCH